MTKAIFTVAACATLLWAGTAQATPTAQEQCDAARITAWKVYASCMDTVVAKNAKGVAFDQFAAFARCRHAYFKKWPGFQDPNRKPPLTGSTCIGVRFADNGDQTVTDNLSSLVWEKKINFDDSVNPSDPHDADNQYSWSVAADDEDGTAFTGFLAALNAGAGFGGSNGWRLPTLLELQSAVVDFACTGPGGGSKCKCPALFVPCIDPALDLDNTPYSFTWSATSDVPNPDQAWYLNFNFFLANHISKTEALYVRAVRGGL